MRSDTTLRCALSVVIPLLLVAIGCARNKPQYLGRVEIVGDVEAPGFYGVYKGQDAKTVVTQAGDVDQERVQFVMLFHAGQNAPYQVLPIKNFRDHGHKISLEPDDVVVFSRIGLPQYYLNAHVEIAGAHPWRPDMTVSDALAAANLEGQHYLKTGIRLSRYGDKEGGRACQRADRVLPGDTILLYDLFQATVPRKQWVTRTPRKKRVMVDAEGELTGVKELNR